MSLDVADKILKLYALKQQSKVAQPPKSYVCVYCGLRRYHLPGQHDQCDHSPTGDCVDPTFKGRDTVEKLVGLGVGKERRLNMPIAANIEAAPSCDSFGDCTNLALKEAKAKGAELYVGTAVRKDRLAEARQTFKERGFLSPTEAFPHAWNVKNGKIIDRALGSKLATNYLYYGFKVPPIVLARLKDGNALADWHHKQQSNKFSVGSDCYLAIAEYVPATGGGLHVYAAAPSADGIKRYLLEEADHECYRATVEEAGDNRSNLEQLSAVWRSYYDKHYHLPGQHDQCDHSVTGECSEDSVAEVENTPFGKNADRVKSLPKNELEVVKKYTDITGGGGGEGTYNETINGALRSDKIPSALAKDIENFDSAINKFPLPKQATVYRGMAADKETLDSIIETKKFGDKAFVSTSRSFDIAADMAIDSGNLVGEEDLNFVVFKIKLSKGFRAMPVEKFSEAATEKEVILKRMTIFSVNKITTITRDVFDAKVKYHIIEVSAE